MAKIAIINRPDNSSSMEEILRDVGHEVRLCFDGYIAIHYPDLDWTIDRVYNIIDWADVILFGDYSIYGYFYGGPIAGKEFLELCKGKKLVGISVWDRKIGKTNLDRREVGNLQWAVRFVKPETVRLLLELIESAQEYE